MYLLEENDEYFIRKEIAKSNLNKVMKLSYIYIFAIIFIIILNSISVMNNTGQASPRFVIPLLAVIAFNMLCIYAVKYIKFPIKKESIKNTELLIYSYICISFLSAAYVTLVNTYFVSGSIFYSLIVFSCATFFVIKPKYFIMPVVFSSAIILSGFYTVHEAPLDFAVQLSYFVTLNVICYLLNNTFYHFFVNNIKIKSELMKENIYRRKISKDLKEANRKLMVQNTFDPLTGLQNRMSFNNYLETLKKLAQSSDIQLTAVMIDIDCFKNYNDFYGHAKGDEVISKVGKVIVNVGEKYGVFAARYGGEEFTLLIHNSSAYKIKLICEELMREVGKLQIPHEVSDVDTIITISIGAESINAKEAKHIVQVLNDADKMLYEVKRNGKNAYLVNVN